LNTAERPNAARRFPIRTPDRQQGEFDKSPHSVAGKAAVVRLGSTLLSSMTVGYREPKFLASSFAHVGDGFRPPVIAVHATLKTDFSVRTAVMALTLRRAAALARGFALLRKYLRRVLWEPKIQERQNAKATNSPVAFARTTGICILPSPMREVVSNKT
jgi:hypothetical protein